MYTRKRLCTYFEHTTGDLGNLDQLDAEAASKLPTLMKLKDALYSETFRVRLQLVLLLLQQI